MENNTEAKPAWFQQYEKDVAAKEEGLKAEITNLKRSQNKQQNQSEQLDKLFEALSLAWKELVDPDADNSAFKHKYASLVDYLKVIRPICSKHGLVIVQQLMQTNGEPYILSTLGHSSGQWMRSCLKIDKNYIDVGKSKNPLIQDIGSTITYLRRYALAPLLGVSTQKEDNDGTSNYR